MGEQNKRDKVQKGLFFSPPNNPEIMFCQSIKPRTFESIHVKHGSVFVLARFLFFFLFFTELDVQLKHGSDFLIFIYPPVTVRVNLPS